MGIRLRDFLDASGATPEQLAARQRDRQRARMLWPFSVVSFLLGVVLGAALF